MFALWNFFMMRMGSGGPGVLSIGQSKAKLVADTGANRITFVDVAGIDEAKEELQEVVDFLKTPERFETLGGRIPRGILLVGAPGHGQDPAGQGGGGGGRRAVLQHLGLRVRGNVRRRRGGARA